MAEEAKTYVFGNDGASSMWPLAAMSNGDKLLQFW